MVYFETQYNHNGKFKTYRTKSLTNYHSMLRNTYGGVTIKCDTTIEWPFGVFSEVIARGN